MIYFAAVPDPTSLPPLPTGTNMVRASGRGLRPCCVFVLSKV